MSKTQNEPTEVYFRELTIAKDRRIRLPSRRAEAYDLEEGDVVDAVVFHDNVTELPVCDKSLDGSLRFTVPKESCERYGIEHRDEVDVLVTIRNDRSEE